MRGAFLALPLLVTAVTCTFRYAKVDSSFPDSISTCLLRSMTFKDASRPVYIRCGAICSHTTYCSLFCVKGVRCDTFSAKVTAGWTGPGSGTYSYDACFSIHPLVGDAALKGPTASFSVYSSFKHEYPVAADFYCNNEVPCYESNIDNPPWWRVDLGSPVPVVAIRVTKVALIDSVIQFRVGNSTDMTTSALLSPSPSFTSIGGMELKSNPPITGRYFFVTEPQSSDIRLCDVWVMTKYYHT